MKDGDTAPLILNLSTRWMEKVDVGYIFSASLICFAAVPMRNS